LPWQPIKVEKSVFFTDQSTLSHCHSEKGLQYPNSDFKRLHTMDISTSCTILVTFGPETSRVYAVNNSTFCGDMAKIGISRQISQNILELS